jgi:biopolymer transport protein TolR
VRRGRELFEPKQTAGVDAFCVEHGRWTAQRARIRRLSTPAELEAGAEGGEINVVPCLDIIMNVMMFVLVSVSVAFASTIGVAAASTDPGRTRLPEGLRLTACARRIKGRPEAAGETQVAVTASPEVPCETVIAVMDGLRSDGEGALFPDVSLGAVR